MLPDQLETIAFYCCRKLSRKEFLLRDNSSFPLPHQAVSHFEEADMHFIFSPINSTYITSILDVSFFKHLKVVWRTILTKRRKINAEQLKNMVLKTMLPHFWK